MRSRCPATMLAAKRTERVKGRIRLLVSSMTTIKGIRTGGVLKGTRWAKISEGDLIMLMIMWPSQRGSAKVIVNAIWLDEVKV